MLKKLLKNNFFQSALAFIAALYIKIVFWTTKWTYQGFPYLEHYVQHKKPVIVCFWHNRLMMGAQAWQFTPPFYMLISAHHDGRIISKIVSHFGIRTIPGSTNRGGTGALKNILSVLKDGNAVGFTPDGPRGPAEQVSPGAIMASYFGKADIVPFAYATTSHRRLSSWDKFMVALPFGRGILAFGKPISYPASKENLETCQHDLQVALNNLTQDVDQHCRRRHDS